VVQEVGEGASAASAAVAAVGAAPTGGSSGGGGDGVGVGVGVGVVVVPFLDPNDLNLVAAVSTKEVKRFGQGLSPKLIAFDCGIKANIIRYFVNVQKVQVTVVPYDYDLEVKKEEKEEESRWGHTHCIKNKNRFLSTTEPKTPI
jgi:hypothetical protein